MEEGRCKHGISNNLYKYALHYYFVKNKWLIALILIILALIILVLYRSGKISYSPPPLLDPFRCTVLNPNNPRCYKIPGPTQPLRVKCTEPGALCCKCPTLNSDGPWDRYVCYSGRCPVSCSPNNMNFCTDPTWCVTRDDCYSRFGNPPGNTKYECVENHCVSVQI